MKKTISKIMALILTLTIAVVPNYAQGATLTTPVDRIQEFTDQVYTIQNKQAFVDLLELIRTVDDQAGLIAVYKEAFSLLTSGQQDRMNSFGATVDAMQAFVNYVMDETFSMSKLEQYLGLDDGNVSDTDKADFYAALARREATFTTYIASVDSATLDRGFDRMDMLFDLMKAYALLGDAFRFMTVTVAYGNLTLNETNANTLIAMANALLSNDIENTATVIAGLQKFVAYYNGKGATSGDRRRMYDYLARYNFVNKPVTIVVTPGTTITITTPATPVVPEAEIDIDINEDVPQGTALFSDIGGYEWAWTAIRQLFIASVVLGKDTEIFDPAGYVKRSEFAAMLSRMIEPELPIGTIDITKVFTDISKTSWYLEEVTTAYRAGYVKGLGGQKFGPEATITREAMATMLGRVLKLEGIEIPDQTEYDTIMADFVDGNDVSSWAEEGSAALVKLGVIQGITVKNEKQLQSKKYATRAETAVMLYRLAALLKDTKVVQFEDTTTN